MRLSGWGKRIAQVRRRPPSAIMRCRSIAIMVVTQVGLVLLPGSAFAQSDRIALKSGESVALGPVYWVANCRSIMVGLPEAEILDGTPGPVRSGEEARVRTLRQIH